MMENRHIVTVVVYDPGQDARIPLFQVPADHVFTVEAAYATADRATAAHADNHFELTLQNGGSDQSGTDAISDEIGGVGGWAANTHKDFTIVDGSGDIEAGDWLMLDYDESGTVAPGLIAVTIEYVDGIGSTA
jgi:hypothetical protein